MTTTLRAPFDLSAVDPKPVGPHLIELHNTSQFCSILIESQQDFWLMMYARFCYLMETCFPSSEKGAA